MVLQDHARNFQNSFQYSCQESGHDSYQDCSKVLARFLQGSYQDSSKISERQDSHDIIPRFLPRLFQDSYQDIYQDSCKILTKNLARFGQFQILSNSRFREYSKILTKTLARFLHDSYKVLTKILPKLAKALVPRKNNLFELVYLQTSKILVWCYGPKPLCHSRSRSQLRQQDPLLNCRLQGR